MRNAESWRLAPACRDAVQGLVVSGFGHLPMAEALLLDASAVPGKAWLRALHDGPDGVVITAASGRARGPDGQDIGCAAIAFSASGLRQLRLDPAVMAGFDAPFLEGMHDIARRQRLHDDMLQPRDRTAPYWGGGLPPGANSTSILCDKTVHAALLLYEPDQAALDATGRRVRAGLTNAGVVVTHSLSLTVGQGGRGRPRHEIFGFADGISQPLPYGDGIVTRQGTAYPRHSVHGVAAGDLLLGHINAHGEPAPGPMVPADAPRAPPGGLLGMNGSYLVIRQLSQDAPSFWNAMAAAAKQIGAPGADWMAERVVGRNRNGDALTGAPADDNDFLYGQNDRDGLHCPLGAHVRRANPRDGLSPTAATRPTDLLGVNAHRILRRGRAYAEQTVPDAGNLPGLLFMCLNTDLRRQYEFVQQNWLLNASFAALIDETDPLLGLGGAFSVPARPIRRCAEVAGAIRFIGGEYFFLPSLPALNYFMSSP